MNDPTKTATLMPEVVENEPAALVVRQEGPKDLQAGAPTIGALAALEEGLQVLDRWAQLHEQLTLACIRMTEPQDWVRSKPKTDAAESAITALPTKAATTKMARLIGLEIAPLEGATDLTPERVQRGAVQGYRVTFRARSLVLKTPWREMETTRWADEDFTGRTVDSEERLVFRGEQALDSDLKSAARTAAVNKGVRELTGLGKVPDALLERAWAGTNKKVADCQRGHGFGRADERASEKVAEAGSQEDAQVLWDELLKMNNGDVAAAGKLLEKVTATEDGKFAKKSIKAFTAGWQVKKAWDRLRLLPEYKGYRQGSVEPQRERESGED